MENTLIAPNEYYQMICKHGYYSKPERLKFYLEKQLFAGIDFKDKRVIDIGGGNGLYGYYALLQGAKEVAIMEPEFDGSSAGVIKQFYEIKELLGNPSNIYHVNKTLQEFDVNEQFDVIVMNNSINHFNEEACVDLHVNEKSQEEYLEIFRIVREISAPKCKLIITDCTNKNFFQLIGVTNPLMNSIEWEKHQPPEVWASFLEKVGFVTDKISWTSPNSFGNLGKQLLGNKAANYFLLGHFRLEMSK